MDGDMIIPEHARPADILVTNWDCGTSAAFDTSQLHPRLIHALCSKRPCMYQGVSAKAAEHRKHNENDPQVC